MDAETCGGLGVEAHGRSAMRSCGFADASRLDWLRNQSLVTRRVHGDTPVFWNGRAQSSHIGGRTFEGSKHSGIQHPDVQHLVSMTLSLIAKRSRV